MTKLATNTDRSRGKIVKLPKTHGAVKRGTPKYKGDVFEALHRSASALRRVGAMDAQTMRNFDVACIQSPATWNKAKVRQLRKRYHMSQPVFAAHLNSTPSTIAQWESGAKQPSKIAAKLLQVLAKHGPGILR
jgi:putative transcriptional regulator